MKSVIQVFTSKRMMLILLLGFSSGLPLALTGSALQAWMVDQHVDLSIIGVFALVALPYTLKFLWAPLLDRYTLPLGLGRRRGWMLATQLALMLAISAMAFSNPAGAPLIVAILALIVSFTSCSQDIVIDAYKIEVLSKDEYGVGAGVGIMGYRIGMLVSGALALILADKLPWKTVYLIMAALMSVGILATLLAPEPTNAIPPRNLRDAVILPFRELFKTVGIIEMLIFLLIYKLDVFMTVAMSTPFFLQMGFSKLEVGSVNKVFGMIATIVGTLLGGGLMVRLGMKRALWGFGVAQAISGFSYMLLAHLGHNFPVMVMAITFENFFSGMGIAAYSAFLMSLCDKRFSATQYALLTSFMALSRSIAGAPAGFLVKAVGWEHYFLICALAGIPGLILLTRYNKWNISRTESV